MYRQAHIRRITLNFLWDIVLRAKQQGTSEMDLFFCQAKEYSPFYEQSFSCLNENRIRSNEIELNLLYRFADMFQEILAEDVEDISQFQRYFIDAALHLILHTDLYHGLTKRDVYIYRLLEELEDGTFWRRAEKEFAIIPNEKRSRIATLVFNQIQTGSSLMTFRRALLVLFPDAVLYQIRTERKKLLLYLSENKTENGERMLLFIQDMFLPISYDLRVFWKYHFGIVGVDEAMRIDEIALY